MRYQGLTANPKAASLADLVECLRCLGERPLKLIAEAAQPEFRESTWTDPLWDFSRDGDTITGKKLLAFPDDSFQFSIATEQSRQDFHLHKKVLEIYVSNFPVELTYQKDGAEEKLGVLSGVLIVPPGIAHRVHLHGLTFVFQVATQGGQVHDDKTVVAQAAETSQP